MASLKTQAIVLRRRSFSESSLIVTLFSRDYGRLDALAKGCRREKSPLFGHLDIYQREEVLVLERPQANLDLLIETAFVDEHAGLRFYPPAFAAAGLLADLVAETGQRGDGQPEVFDVLAESMAVLSRLGEPAARAGLASPTGFSAADRRILVVRTLKLALLEILDRLGFGLELRRCAACGAIPDGDVAISRRQGGLVCRACRTSARDATAIAPRALASLRDRDAGSERLELEMPEGERMRWLGFLVDYGQYVMDRPLRSMKALTQMLVPERGAGCRMLAENR